MTKNTKITLIKLMAQVVSTYHMFDVLSVYGPLAIAAVAALSLGMGEYMISQEYAIMSPRHKLKKLMMATLIGLSAISMLANIESFARHYNWYNVDGVKFWYVAFAGFVYSISMPAVIVTTSFIKLSEPEKSNVKETVEVKNEEKSVEIPQVRIIRKRQKENSFGLDPFVRKQLMAM